MRETIRPRRLIAYADSDGNEPFIEWRKSIRDKMTKSRIQQRLVRLSEGNLGDCRSVGDGVYELRLHFGPGYRIYFGEDGDTLVILLCGGDKGTQRRDIPRAKRYWQHYLESTR